HHGRYDMVDRAQRRGRLLSLAALIVLLLGAVRGAAQPQPRPSEPPRPTLPAVTPERPLSAPSNLPTPTPPSSPGLPQAGSTSSGAPLPPPLPPQPTMAPPRFTFDIPADTPHKKLLPTAPKGRKPAGPFLGDDLARVPEAQFEAPLGKDVSG